MKCENCNREFEGVFCPYCGTQTDIFEKQGKLPVKTKLSAPANDFVQSAQRVKAKGFGKKRFSTGAKIAMIAAGAVIVALVLIFLFTPALDKMKGSLNPGAQRNTSSSEDGKAGKTAGHKDPGRQKVKVLNNTFHIPKTWKIENRQNLERKYTVTKGGVFEVTYEQGMNVLNIREEVLNSFVSAEDYKIIQQDKTTADGFLAYRYAGTYQDGKSTYYFELLLYDVIRDGMVYYMSVPEQDKEQYQEEFEAMADSIKIDIKNQ